MSRIVDRSGGVVTEYHYQPHTNQFHINHVQDVEPILEANKRLANEPRKDAGHWRHLAEIPLVVWWTWQREGVTRDKTAIRKKLDDPEWRYLKSSRKRLYRRATRTENLVSNHLASFRKQAAQETSAAVKKAGLIPVSV